ncbi:MAG: hypothetical protein U0325_01755 [Polyangiales bacterium]
MIDVGTRLGGKYFVVARQERIAIGDRFEVRTPQGEVRWAQWLHRDALSAPQVAALQAELSAVPGHSAVRAPVELVTSPGGIPAAIFERDFARPLQELIPGLVVAGQESRRLPTARTLVAWCAGLADSLSALHKASVVHGALALQHLGVEGDGEGARVLIQGFGLEPARRIATNAARPTLRADLAAVVLILQSLFEQCGVKLTGTALVRWDVLRNCARAGDHVALTHGAALAQALRELIQEEEADHRARTAVSRLALPAAAVATETAAPPDPRRRRFWIVAAIGLSAAAAGTALALRADQGTSTLLRGIATRNSLASGRCGEEPMAPTVGVAIAAPARALGAACGSDGALRVAILSGDVLSLAQRPARRGERFRGAPQRLAEGVAEFAVLSDDPEPLALWRRTAGAPFAAARLTASAESVALAQGSWRADQFRGVWPLRAERDALWVASNLLVAGAPRAVVLRLPTDDREAPSAFRIGEVTLLAAIAGPAATLLVQDGQQVLAITIATNALRVLSTDAGPAASPDDVATRTVPLDALPRSEPWRFSGRWVLAAPEGVTVPGGARHFAVTVGDTPLPAGCTASACAARGVVHALAFAERGPPIAVQLTAHGLAASVGLEADGTRRVAGNGAASADATVWTVDTSDTVSEVPLRDVATPTAILACGDDLWIAHDEQAPRLAASPMTCALLHRR